MDAGESVGGSAQKAPYGATFRGLRRGNNRVLRGNDKFQRPCLAEFKNRCVKCKLLIHPGQPIVKDMSIRKFVHAECARVQQPVVDRDARAEAELGIKNGVQPQLPHGLSAASLRDYMAEWDRYKQFASERRAAPLTVY